MHCFTLSGMCNVPQFMAGIFEESTEYIFFPEMQNFQIYIPFTSKITGIRKKIIVL